ncbi:MAG: glycosyltransferase, partial [Halioglobus sp.]|nr:glycosyltransferase [Halioglobus sp.]
TVAIYAGRLGKEKNLDFLLDAFARLPAELDWRLLLVGEGAESGLLQERVASLQLQRRVLFTGPLPYQEMPQVYAAGDLFVITSTTEVKPLVVLEAMASGLPVVAVAACGTEDTLTHQHDGLLSTSDLEAYSLQLQQAIRDADGRFRWGQNARRTAAQYGIDNYTRRLDGLYQGVIEQKR